MVDDEHAVAKKRDRKIKVARLFPNQTRVGDMERELYCNLDYESGDDPEQDRDSLYDYKIGNLTFLENEKRKNR